MFGTNYYGRTYLGGVGASTNQTETLAQILTGSVVAPVFLAELTAGKTYPIWTGLGFGVWYIEAEEDFVHTLKVNGVELEETGDFSAYDRWHFEKSVGKIYIHVDYDPNALDKVIQVIYKFYVADTAIEKNDLYWDGLISSLPALSLRSDLKFGGIFQLGGGSLELRNETGLWNSRLNYEWLAGECNIKMGTVSLPYEDFVQIGSWSCDSVELNPKTFSVNLLEKKLKIDVSIPLDIYTADEYPALKVEDVGKPKQWAYGTIYGAEAVCIDTTNGIFKLADHPIRSIDSIRVLNDQAWTRVNPTTTDLVSGTFVLGSGSWTLDGNQKVSVDFTGKMKDDGYLMNNGADIVTDIFTNLGVSNLDTASFSESERLLQVGYFGHNTGDKYCVRTPSLYINDFKDASEVFQTINDVTNAYMFVGGDGNFRYQVFTSKPVEGLVSFSDPDILSFKAETQGGVKSSSAVINFAERMADGWSQTVTVTNSGNQFLRNQQQPVLDTRTVALSTLADAKRYGQQVIFENQFPPISYSISVKWGAWLLTAGDLIHLTYSERNLDLVLEIQEIDYDLTGRVVNLVLTTMHGLSGRQGHWVEDDTTYDWGNGSSSLTQTQKQQNSGHWLSSLDLATTGTATSSDYKISVWS